MEKPIDPYKVIVGATLSGYLNKGVGFVASLITLPIIIGNLSKVEYGIIAVMGQAVSFLTLSDLGITNAIGRFVSRYRYPVYDENSNSLNELISTSFCLLMISSAFVLLIVSLLSIWIPNILNIERSYASPSRVIFLINGYVLAFLFPTYVGNGILAGYQRYRIINITGIVTILIQLLGVFVLLVIGRLKIIELTLLYALSSLITQLIILVLSYRHTGCKINPKHFRIDRAKEIIDLGVSSLLITLSGMLSRQGLLVAVGILLSTAMAGVYNVALSIMTHISFILTKMTQPITTLSSELVARRDHDKLRLLCNQVMRYSFALGSMVSVLLFFFGEPFLRLLIRRNWEQSDYKDAGLALSVMSMCIAIGIPQMVSRSMLQGVGLHWKVSTRFILASIISFALSIVLMKLGYGILAASIGWGLTWILQGLIFYPFIALRYLRQGVIELLRAVYLPVLASAFATSIFASFLIKVLAPNTTVNMLFDVALITCIGAVLFLIINRDVVRLRNVINKRIGRLIRNSK